MVGSGFGGSVTALSLTEKGYRVGCSTPGAASAPPTTRCPPQSVILLVMQTLDSLALYRRRGPFVPVEAPKGVRGES